MAPYEALYEHKCRSSIGWFDVGESGLHGLDLVQHAIEKVKLIRERLLTAQSRQKSYSDMRRQDVEFGVNDWRVGQVAYELELPSELESVHPIFHVSMLRKCIGDPTQVVPTDDVQITKDLSYEEIVIAILDQQIHKLRNKEVASVKVLWRSKNVEEMTWEAEEEMKSKYPHLFQNEDMARGGIPQHNSIRASRSSAMDVHVEDDVDGRIELEARYIPAEDYVGWMVKMNEMNLNKRIKVLCVVVGSCQLG
ncbi:PREDICTED: uncharacterized protein LOC109218436 [Nicotiana attenuata]|uniref:uncharacterized protein LOC109218436 n=1 Tax=Nicotiana attenuata TaxID=49451 RepID=UPI000905B5F8|nr:PREDICTED: uncharacterized protein LOC109218436 [Nicotiana attenuata]